MGSRLSMNGAHLGFARNIPLFRGLTDAEKDSLLKDGGIYAYPRRNTLFIQGDAISSLYVVCAGTVQLSRSTPDGREVTTDIRSAGDTVGEKEMFSSGSRHQVSAIAVDHVEAFKLPAERVRAVAGSNVVLSRNLLASIAQSATQREVEMEHRATMKSSQVISCYLQHLCVSRGFDPRGFTLPYKKSLIASRLGMELETFSRALPVLKENGIAVEGAHVAFRDFDAVDDHTCGLCSVNDFCRAHRKIREERKAEGDEHGPENHSCAVQRI
ncbi:MAG: Crp/Fnr family transcriptional regulator [Alphaproteobacteria bacterium]|nr:Crp/Fnr family transcriptional regulator [Alphaproteobacteria bacterium]MDE2335780.1 Crp/Fnr family transcriptional regulator [Alphaproteobacteria bacterium]